MNQDMSFAGWIRAVGISDCAALSETDWLAARASFNPENLFCLRADWLEQTLIKLKMPDDVKAAFREARLGLAGQKEWALLIWCFWRMLDAGTKTAEVALKTEGAHDEQDAQKLRNWPVISGSMLPNAAMAYAFVCLAGLPRLAKLHQKRGIDPAITYDTMADIVLWIRDFYQKTGAWGLDRKIIPWVAGYLAGRLIKLGRLQYCPAQFPYDLHCFVRKRDGRLLMLAGAGARFGTEGQYFEEGTGAKDYRAWTSCRRENTESFGGNPISARGAAHEHQVALLKRLWKPVLRRNDPILQVHIPASGPLDPEACRQSLRRVCGFFAKHYPEVNFKALTCVSWLMDNQFGRYLERNANIRQFQSLFYLHPVPGANERQTYERVFGDEHVAIDKAPQNTSLQRLVVKHVRQGGRWHHGGGVIIRAAECGPGVIKEGKKRYTI